MRWLICRTAIAVGLGGCADVRDLPAPTGDVNRAAALSTPAPLPSSPASTGPGSLWDTPTPVFATNVRLWGWVWVRGPRSSFAVGESLVLDGDGIRTADPRGGAPQFGNRPLRWEIDPRDTARATFEPATPTTGVSAVRVLARAPGPIRVYAVADGVFYGRAALLCTPHTRDASQILDDARFPLFSKVGYGLPDGVYLVRDEAEWKRLWFGERTSAGDIPPKVAPEFRDRVPSKLKRPPHLDFSVETLVVLTSTFVGQNDAGLVAVEPEPPGSVAAVLTGFPTSGLPPRTLPITRTYLYRVPRLPAETRTSFEDLTLVEDELVGLRAPTGSRETK